MLYHRIGTLREGARDGGLGEEEGVVRIARGVLLRLEKRVKVPER